MNNITVILAIVGAVCILIAIIAYFSTLMENSNETNILVKKINKRLKKEVKNGNE